MLLWGLLEFGDGESPEPEGEGRNKGFHWWMGTIRREGAGEYLNLTLPLSPSPQVPRGQECTLWGYPPWVPELEAKVDKASVEDCQLPSSPDGGSRWAQM